MVKIIQLLIAFALSFICITANAAIDVSLPDTGNNATLPNWAKASNPSSISTDNPFATGGGAGGSWGDPYSGNGGSTGGGGAGDSWGGGGGTNTCEVYWIGSTQASTSQAVCDLFVSKYDAIIYDVKNITASETKCSYSIASKGQTNWNPQQFSITKTTSNTCKCKSTETFDTTLNKCIPKCPERQKYDPNQGKCVVDPNQCLPPYTLIGGICVAPKDPPKDPIKCPVGYTLQGETCVKDPDEPPKTCDPAVQDCNPDGTPKCDCCAKLDKIIGNQGIQIQLHNRTNDLLNQSLATQKTGNLKLDTLNQTMNKVGDITYKGFDTTIQQNQLGNSYLKQIEINTRPSSATAATSTTAPTSAPSPTDPEKPEKGDYDPYGSLYGFDITTNRINSAAQCPADKSINIMGRSYSLHMSMYCTLLASLAPIFLALAFFKGASIIVKGTE